MFGVRVEKKSENDCLTIKQIETHDKLRKHEIQKKFDNINLCLTFIASILCDKCEFFD